MRITDFVQAVRDELDDTNQLKWSDAEIVRHTDMQTKAMFRTMVSANKEWQNFSLCLQLESAKNLFKNVFEWRLPSWVEKVRKVYNRAGTATVETTYSPYRWTNSSNVELGQEILPSDPSRRDGWTWEGNKTFRLWNFTGAQELVLQLVKLPAPMFKGKIATAHASAAFDGLYLPQTLILGTLALEEGAYMNAELQVTQCANGISTNNGEMRRVDYSRSNAIVTSTRQNELRLEYGLLEALTVDDIVESMIGVPDIHSRLLQLMVVNACAVKKNNLDLQKSVVNELMKETAEFVAYAAAPRDQAGPYFYTSGQRQRRRYSPDVRSAPYPWPWGT